MAHTYEISVIGLGIIRLVAAFLFLYAYYKSKRKSALIIALSWIATIPTTTFGFIDMRIENIFIGLAFALWYTGILSIIKEETTIPIPRESLLIPPILLVVFAIAQSIFEKYFPEDAYYLGGLLTVVVGSIGMRVLSTRYGKDGKRLGAMILITGLISMLYPPVYQYAIATQDLLIGAQIVAVALGFGVFYFYYRVIFTPHFLFGHKMGTTGVSKLTGVHIISPEDYENVKGEIENLPVLAFLRSLKPAEAWNAFFFTTVGDISARNHTPPTDLYKVTETVNRYITEARRSGFNGIVLIEGIEYLRLYNEFPSIAKMLSTVRDYVISNKGALIVVIDKNALDEKEYAILRRILE